METDGGGWTLFFNYRHQPGEEVTLDQNQLPKDLKINSHMYLFNAGFSPRDITEVRFICTERFRGKDVFWHFKTGDNDIINTALTGSQANMRVNIFFKFLEKFIIGELYRIKCFRAY